MLILSFKYSESVFFTKEDKKWSFLQDSDRLWRTSTDFWPTKKDWTRSDIKLLGPTTLVIWSE